MIFMFQNKIDFAFELLKDGFNPNVKDNAGWTPLVFIFIFHFIMKKIVICNCICSMMQ